MTNLKEIAKALLSSDNIVIFPHIGADGDAMGSSSALCYALKELGKDCHIFYDQDLADNLDFLGPEFIIRDASSLDNIGFGLMIDCEGRKRIGETSYEVFKKAKLKGCIDHHSSPASDEVYDFYYCEPDSAATAELAYLLIKELGVELNLDIANCIWTGITTDTGNFQHSNTTKRSHEIVSELYDVEGFSSKPISVLIYDRKKKNLVALESEVLMNLEFFEDDKLGVGVVTKNMREKLSIKPQDIDFLVNRIGTINGVEVSVLIKEEDERIKASLRSKSYVDVSKVCEKLGGGGHIRAAGASFDPADYTVLMVKDMVVDALKEVL